MRWWPGVVDWEDFRGNRGVWLVTSSEGSRRLRSGRVYLCWGGWQKGSELCIYFVLYFSRLGGFQEETFVDWVVHRVKHVCSDVVLRPTLKNSRQSTVSWPSEVTGSVTLSVTQTSKGRLKVVPNQYPDQVTVITIPSEHLETGWIGNGVESPTDSLKSVLKKIIFNVWEIRKYKI